jgi:hypothetical protein
VDPGDHQDPQEPDRQGEVVDRPQGPRRQDDVDGPAWLDRPRHQAAQAPVDARLAAELPVVAAVHREVLEDVLVLDAGCIEKERNLDGWIVAMYPVDGATIRPNIDEYGGFDGDAYVQMIDGQVTARFGSRTSSTSWTTRMTDVSSRVRLLPRREPDPVRHRRAVRVEVQRQLLREGLVPEGLLDLGEDVDPEDVDAFRLYWANEIMGKPWALPIVGGEGRRVDAVAPAEPRHAVHGVPAVAAEEDVRRLPDRKQEVGELEDVNRSTADEQADTNQTKSLTPILTLYEDAFEVEVIGEYGLGVGDLVKFEFDKEDDDEAQIDQAFGARVQAGAATRNEWREAVGLDPSDEEGADMLLVAGQLNPLPSEEDAAVMGAAAQQQHEDEQAQQQDQVNGVGQGTMPWKPANPADPKFQDAKQQHDMTAGLGPRQEPPGDVGKSARDHDRVGRDRNPALTEVHDDLDTVFDGAQADLYGRLERILGVPLDEAERIAATSR